MCACGHDIWIDRPLGEIFAFLADSFQVSPRILAQGINVALDLLHRAPLDWFRGEGRRDRFGFGRGYACVAFTIQRKCKAKACGKYQAEP